jgi:hypothetical protein
MPWPTLLGRVVLRTGVALWRHRVAVIVAGLLVVAFSAYELTFAGPSSATAGPVGGGDCADTAMQALTHVTDASARAAYACLGPQMRTTSEDEFVSTMVQRAAGNGQADRVADRHTPDGGKIVFYTVSAGNTPAVGYIVYLDSNGKVAKVE